jgi:hypothetical protein
VVFGVASCTYIRGTNVFDMVIDDRIAERFAFLCRGSWYA